MERLGIDLYDVLYPDAVISLREHIRDLLQRLFFPLHTRRVALPAQRRPGRRRAGFSLCAGLSGARQIEHFGGTRCQFGLQDTSRANRSNCRRCHDFGTEMGICGTAGDATRTRNNQLGRLELYQLSYTRESADITAEPVHVDKE